MKSANVYIQSESDEENEVAAGYKKQIAQLKKAIDLYKKTNDAANKNVEMLSSKLSNMERENQEKLNEL